MNVDLLSSPHPTHDAACWRRYDALYRGGDCFRACLDDFLPRNPDEPEAVYAARKKEAHFIPYAGPIVDWFAAKLCAASLVVRAKSRGGDTLATEPDPFYAAFKEDVDGAGTDLVDFLRARLTAALVKGRAWWLVELPDDEGRAPANRAEWEARALGRACLTPLENEQVLDWEVDARGELMWAIVHSYETRREDWRTARGRIVETWRVFDRETVETWEISHLPEEQRPKEARFVGRRAHGFARVPLVCLGFVGMRGVRVRVRLRVMTVSSGALEGFWLLRRLAEPQIAHFRSSAALDWNIKRTCYAMPVLCMAGDEGAGPTMGAGYYMRLGKDDKAEWMAPPTGHLAVLDGRIAHLKDEIYRVANQMASGVDNNAAAIGRSGESKQADATSTEVVLKVYGAVCREAVERTYELLSEGRDDAVAWSIEGLDTFSLVDAAAVLDAATQIDALAIPSRTLRCEVYKRVADVALPGADQPTKDKIRAEIDAGVEAEAELRREMAKAMAGGEDDEADEGEEPSEEEAA